MPLLFLCGNIVKFSFVFLCIKWIAFSRFVMVKYILIDA